MVEAAIPQHVPQRPGGAAALGFRPGNADGFATIEGSNNRVGFTIGTLLSPTENTHIGIAYRSKTKHDIDNGKAYFDVPSNAAAVLADNMENELTGGRDDF